MRLLSNPIPYSHDIDIHTNDGANNMAGNNRKDRRSKKLAGKTTIQKGAKKKARQTKK